MTPKPITIGITNAREIADILLWVSQLPCEPDDTRLANIRRIASRQYNRITNQTVQTHGVRLSNKKNKNGNTKNQTGQQPQH